MKIAFCILAHNHPEQLRKLIHALDDPRFDFFIHLDAKADASVFQFDSYTLNHSHLTIPEARIPCFWGDISLVDAELLLYQAALNAGNYGRFVTLSGNDFPIQSNDSIYSQLTQSDTEYIKLQPIREENRHRIRNFFFWKLRSQFLFRLLKKTFKILHLHQKKHLVVGSQKWMIHESSQWHALTRQCIIHILNILEMNPQIRSYFRFSYAPDALLIPTIIGNSPIFYQKTVSSQSHTPYPFNGLTATHHLVYSPTSAGTVKVLTEDDYPQLISSGKLFARKFIPGKSDNLMVLLSKFRAG